MSRRRASRAALALAVLVGSAVLSVSMRASSETRLRLTYQRQDGKVHPELYALEASEGRPRAGEQRARSLGVQAGDGYVTIAAFPANGSRRLLRDLERLGLEDASATADLVNGRLPVRAIDAAGELDSLQYLRPEWAVSSAVQGQGDKAIGADIARTTFGVTGAGVKVGVLSDSFGCRGSSEGEFPDVQVLKEGPCEISVDENGPIDEGRAMIEHIADVAPAATPLFRTAKLGPVDFADGIRELRDAGARVIVDDIGYPAEPWFRDGVVAQAVDEVVAEGVSYFSAAGNAADAAYQAPFEDSGIRVGPAGSAMRAHDFDAGPAVDPTQRITVPPNDIALLAFQWDDNFKTLGSSGAGPLTDLDIVPIGADGSVLPLSVPGASLNESEPFEVLAVANPDDTPLPVDLVVVRASGPDPAMMKWIQMPLSTKFVTVEEHATEGAGTIFGHPQAFGAMALGAASYRATPAFGASPPVLEEYSSVGGGVITADVNGDPIGTAVRPLKPTFVAPDDANTSFFGLDTDGDGLKNFEGTSAAAPHAAAVAALALEKVPTAAPADVCNAFANTAIDMGEQTGPDIASGHGLIDANAALSELTATTKKDASDRCKTVGVAVGAVKKQEGSSGTTVFSFKVTKLGRTSSPIDVDYTTLDGTAKSGSDYTAASGVVSLAPSDVSKSVDVQITGDGDIEPDETFDLQLELKDPASANVLLMSTLGTATITDDDDPTASVEAANYVTWGKASPSTGSPGDKVKIAGLGFKPDSELSGTFHSTPVTLGTITSNAAGGFAAVATVPAVESGSHHIEISGPNAEGGTRTIRFPVTVVNGVSPGTTSTGVASSGGVTTGVTTMTSVLPATVTSAPAAAQSPSSLPTTGMNVTFFAELGSLLVVVGAGAILGSRRRRRALH